ncbi:MAG: putative rane protein [Deltaproteobacteria bacterium]|nr:putative rane protein [Deltaproteobacteria bacterium]
MTDQPNYGFTPGPPPGAPPGGPGYAPGPQGAPPQGNGMAVAALVLGIIALVLFFIPFLNWILAILGIVFGAVGMSKANKIGGRGKGLAMTGLILGVLSAVVSTAFFIWAMKEARRVSRFDRYGDVMVPVTRSVAEISAPTPDRG